MGCCIRSVEISGCATGRVVKSGKGNSGQKISA